jgi:WD40 repeat protein
VQRQSVEFSDLAQRDAMLVHVFGNDLSAIMHKTAVRIHERQVAFSPDGHLLAVALGNNTLKFFDSASLRRAESVITEAVFGWSEKIEHAGVFHHTT